MFRTMSLTVVFVSLCAASTGIAMPVHSASDDFNTVTNTDGQRWTYRVSDDRVRDGAYPLLSGFVFQGFFAPDIGVWGGLSRGVGINENGADSTFVGNSNTFIFPDNHVFMHPNSGGMVVLTWLSPITGNVQVDLTVTDVDRNGGNGVAWYLDLNDTPVPGAAGNLTAVAASGPQQFNVAVNAGDELHLIVDSLTDHFFDSTAVTMEVTLPEPASAMLLTISAAVVLRRRRR